MSQDTITPVNSEVDDLIGGHKDSLDQDTGVKKIVMVHVQNFADPEHFERLAVRDEMRDAGVKNILQAEDGDLY